MILNLLDFTIMALAVWRLARLVTQESGPANVFGRLRDYFDADNAADGSPGELVSCKACASVWIGLLVVIGYMTLPMVATVVCCALSLSAVTLMIERLIKKPEPPPLPMGPPDDYLMEG